MAFGDEVKGINDPCQEPSSRVSSVGGATNSRSRRLDKLDRLRACLACLNSESCLEARSLSSQDPSYFAGLLSTANVSEETTVQLIFFLSVKMYCTPGVIFVKNSTAGRRNWGSQSTFRHSSSLTLAVVGSVPASGVVTVAKEYHMLVC